MHPSPNTFPYSLSPPAQMHTLIIVYSLRNAIMPISEQKYNYSNRPNRHALMPRGKKNNPQPIQNKKGKIFFRFNPTQEIDNGK